MNPKTRQCKEQATGCEDYFQDWAWDIQMKRCCKNPNCVLSRTIKNREKAEAKKAKAERKQTRAQKQAAKTLKELLAEAQVYCNRAIRLRDDGKPCFTCGKHKENMQAGHYYHAGSGAHWPIRFHPSNINIQCVYCNKHRSGVSAICKIKLIELHGVEMVEYLENHPPYSFTKEEAIEIKRHFMEECKRLTEESR